MEPHTALWQHRLRQRSFVVRVNIQIRVGVADCSVLGVDTCTVSVGLVRVVHDVVVLLGLLEAVSTQQVEIQASDGLPVELALELHIDNRQVNIVVLQFMENVEVGIVTG